MPWKSVAYAIDIRGICHRHLRHMPCMNWTTAFVTVHALPFVFFVAFVDNKYLCGVRAATVGSPPYIAGEASLSEKIKALLFC